jgi:hypothetical protein
MHSRVISSQNGSGSGGGGGGSGHVFAQISSNLPTGYTPIWQRTGDKKTRSRGFSALDTVRSVATGLIDPFVKELWL